MDRQLSGLLGGVVIGLAGGLRDAMVFVPAMLAGSYCHHRLDRRAKIGGE